MSQLTDNKLIIGGVNRSGTSLVRALVGSHPQIAVPKVETSLLRRLAEIDATATGAPLDNRALSDLLGSGKLGLLGLTVERVRAEQGDGPGNAADLYCAILKAYAETQKKPFFAEKTTLNERYFETALRWFGDGTRMLYVVRDPLNVFGSILFFTGTPQSVDPVSWTQTWSGSVTRALQLARSYPDQFRIVRYEDCARDPSVTAADLCAFMGVEPCVEEMLQMKSYGKFDNSSFRSACDSGQAVASTDRATSHVVDRSAERRDKYIPKLIRRFIVAEIADTARLVGYDVGPTDIAGRIFRLRGIRHYIRMRGIKHGRSPKKHS